MANWQEPWAKASLRRVRSPAVRPSLSCADQTRIRPLKLDNVNGQRALATSHIRELWVTPDPPVAWMLMVGDLEKSLLSFLSQSSRMSVVVVDLRGAVMEGGVVHLESPRVSSTVGSSAHWMDGDHSLGGVCIPNIPRPWHVCVSAERGCSLHRWKPWQKG